MYAPVRDSCDSRDRGASRSGGAPPLCGASAGEFEGGGLGATDGALALARSLGRGRLRAQAGRGLRGEAALRGIKLGARAAQSGRLVLEIARHVLRAARRGRAPRPFGDVLRRALLRIELATSGSSSLAPSRSVISTPSLPVAWAADRLVRPRGLPDARAAPGAERPRAPDLGPRNAHPAALSQIEFFRQHLPPHARIEEPEGFGHTPFLEHPGRVASDILSFAAEVGSGGGASLNTPATPGRA
jgi:hypothetical protein